MVKANVNTASREELIEVGVRAELADEILKLRRKGKITSAPLKSIVKDFYLTNPIARASAVMAELSRLKALALSGRGAEAAE